MTLEYDRLLSGYWLLEEKSKIFYKGIDFEVDSEVEEDSCTDTEESLGAEYSRLISRKSLDKQRDKTLSLLKMRKDRLITKVVASSVFELLDVLYKQLGEFSCRKIEVNEASWELMRKLYSANNSDMFEVVGPLGERPLHVCALTAARYRGEQQNGGIQIAKGIVRGMKKFLEDEQITRKDNPSVPYRKDYIAAVASFISEIHEENDEKWRGKIRDSFPKGLPFLRDVVEWCQQMLRDRRFCVRNDMHKDFRKSTVCIGLYEDETILFPFIASSDEVAVRWLSLFIGKTGHNEAESR